jgi:hypothetical protein
LNGLHLSNDVDVIIFSIYENGYKQCSDTALGTYVTPVPSFMQGYLNQKAQDTEDQGMEFEWPSAAQYAYCTPFMSNQVYYYFQLGCSDSSNQEIAVNIYDDNTCTKRSAVEGLDDANIDVSAIQVRHSALVADDTDIQCGCSRCLHCHDVACIQEMLHVRQLVR